MGERDSDQYRSDGHYSFCLTRGSYDFAVLDNETIIAETIVAVEQDVVDGVWRRHNIRCDWRYE